MKRKTSYHRAVGSTEAHDNLDADDGVVDGRDGEASSDDRFGSPAKEDESEASSELVEQADME